MTQGPRSRWWRFYTTLPDDKAHYTDAQFRAYVTAISIGEELPPYGQLPKLPALRAMLGPEIVDFLIEQGDIDVSGDRPHVVGRESYQAPADRTAADRKRAQRERERASSEDVDNVVTTVTSRRDNRDKGGTSRRDPLPSTLSIEEDVTNGEVETGAFMPDSPDRDALDRFYELTGIRPWGKRIGSWIRELEVAHGEVHVTAAMEVEAKDGTEKLVDRVAARLERQAERVKRARVNGHPKLDPVTEQMRQTLEAQKVEPGPEVDTSPEGIAAAKAAWESMRRPQSRGGTQSIAAVLGSTVAAGADVSAPTDVGTRGSAGPTRDPASGSPSAGARGPSVAEQAADHP